MRHGKGERDRVVHVLGTEAYLKRHKSLGGGAGGWLDCYQGHGDIWGCGAAGAHVWVHSS